jgi:hypothetical protein
LQDLVEKASHADMQHTQGVKLITLYRHGWKDWQYRQVVTMPSTDEQLGQLWYRAGCFDHIV